MIEWNDNAKAAVRAFADYIGQTKKCHRYLESFASKKTIADAVEWANGKWKDDCQYMLYHEELGKFSFVVSEGPYVNGWQLVCTREQFEAYVEEQEKPQPHFKATRENLEKIAKDAQGDFVEVEQEGEKWTHITPLGSKCKVLAVDGEHSWVLTEHGSRTTEFASSLKPIKPTISQEQAKAVMEFATEHGLISEGQIWTRKEREIIEGTAND